MQVELRISVHDDIPSLDAIILHPHGGTPGLLHDPRFVGVERGRGAENAPCAQVQKHEHVGLERSAPSIDGPSVCRLLGPARLGEGLREGGCAIDGGQVPAQSPAATPAKGAIIRAAPIATLASRMRLRDEITSS